MVSSIDEQPCIGNTLFLGGPMQERRRWIGSAVII